MKFVFGLLTEVFAGMLTAIGSVAPDLGEMLSNIVSFFVNLF